MNTKETLEEAAFIAGEEAFKGFKKAVSEANRFDYVCGFTRGTKWQQEQENKKYSDEDMMFAYEQGARLALISQSPLALHKGEFPTPKEWFEQFKNK